MREVKPTQKPVPSSDIKDLFFNSGLLDIWATSLKHKYIDRFGNCHLTAAGMEWLFKELVEKFKVDMNTAIVAAGYITIDSFQQGADLPNNELTQRNHILRDEITGEYYRWDGDLPKRVPAGSTQQSTGGIGKGAWVSVGDASLRSDIKLNSGASMIGSSTGENIEVRLNAAENSADLARKGRNPKFVKIKHIISFEEQGYQSIVNQHAYTLFGQQGMFVDTIDSKLYLSYQTIGGEGDYLNKTWVIVFDWKTGKRLLRLCTDTRSAPEGISVIHDGNNRILLLPNHENYTTRKYIINDSTQDMSYLVRSESFPTGARYQFGHYGDKIAFNRDISQGTGIDDDNANRVDIYPVSQFISGSELKKISSLSIDSMISGRGGMKPKRQGLTLGDNCIVTSCGGDTSTTASKSDGMYGFMKFNFDGSLAVDGLFDPADFRNEMMNAGYPDIRTMENEGCCVTNENGIAEIYSCSLSVLRGGNYQNRVCIIIQHNCEYDDETLDLSNITSSFNQFYNDFPTRIHTLTADNPRSNEQFQNAGEVCEYMRSLGVSTYTLTTQSNFNVDVDAVIVVPSKTTITIESIDHNIFRVRWSLTSGWQGDIRLYKSELYKLTENSYNSLRNESLPVFSGSQSIGVVNCPTWSPVGTGNGFLFESGYNQNRVGQLFISSTGEMYSRFATFESRNTTTGWKKY
ncbi:hypothetical protein [Providencia vermicola]|uniref:tail fiber/spike domain-containing protein n=1 Tax=Providencia vermicola TaxID=333965 RepID=UPI0032DB5043